MICGKQFKQITLQHLARHNIDISHYRELFPTAPLVSMAIKAKVSDASVRTNSTRKGKKRSEKDIAAIKAGKAKKPHPAHNKGKAMSDEQKTLLSELAKERFRNGFTVSLYERTPEIREKISKTLTGRKIDPEITQRSIATRISRGHGGAPTFRGHHHTEETKKRIRQKVKERAEHDRLHNRVYMQERINESNLILLNDIVSDIFQLRCRKCGYEFTRTPQVFTNSKYHNEVCDQCYPISSVSNAENQVADFIKSIFTKTVLRSDMEIISPLELDIVLPELNLAIEYNGLYWHSEIAGKKRWYHGYKYQNCQDAGYRLISIFEDEWIHKPDIVKSMLMNAIGGNINKISARSCEVRLLDSREGNEFITLNHIQGRGRASLYYGLYHNDTLVSVMSFSKSEISRKSIGWDINRFCSILNTSVQGAAGKLFKAFLRDNDPEIVTSYADLRWGTGNVYGAIGFRHITNTVPNYWYFKGTKRYHRYGLRKNKDDDQSLTEWENRQKQGWNRIWDCGHAKWIWERK
jgi:hypothetical protein